MNLIRTILTLVVGSALLASAQDRIGTVADLAQDSKRKSATHRPFEVTATISSVVTVSAKPLYLTLADATSHALVFLSAESREQAIHPGDRIRASGEIRWTRPNMPTARCLKLEVLGSGEAPKARPVSLAEAQSGKIDWELVRVSGLVRDVLPSETNASWTILLLCAKGETLYVAVYTEGDQIAALRGLLGKEVDIEGFANPQTGSRRNYAGRIFQCVDLQHVHVQKNARKPFDVPPTSALHYLEPRQIAAFGRVRAKGRVLARWNEREALIQTPPGEVLHVRAEDTQLPPRGASVEVSGFPTSDLFNLTLSHALWRETEAIPATDTAITEITAPNILSAHHHKPSKNAALHGHEIRLKAMLRDTFADGPEHTLLVEDHGYTIPVEVSAAGESVREIEPGSLMEITGTCVLETNDWSPSRAFPQIHGFRIVVHATDGLRVLAHPPWWNATRLWTFVLSLCAVLVGIFIWNLALRRAAARKGRELLREQIGHLKAQMKAEERTRLAVELHDSLAQNLTGVSLEIDTAGRVADEDPQALKEHLGIAARTLKSCRDELRNCLWDLRNHALEAHTMDEAIRQTLAPHVLGVELTIRFNLPRERLADNTAHTILTVIRELVLNAVRHGKATKIQVAGHDDNGTLAFSVRDNGTGFDPKTAPGVLQGHYGLLGIQERIEAFEGEFKLDSTPGAGTKATIRIHLSDTERT